jgi:hypothetical protein
MNTFHVTGTLYDILTQTQFRPGLKASVKEHSMEVLEDIILASKSYKSASKTKKKALYSWVVEGEDLSKKDWVKFFNKYDPKTQVLLEKFIWKFYRKKLSSGLIQFVNDLATEISEEASRLILAQPYQLMIEKMAGKLEEIPTLNYVRTKFGDLYYKYKLYLLHAQELLSQAQELNSRDWEDVAIEPHVSNKPNKGKLKRLIQTLQEFTTDIDRLEHQYRQLQTKQKRSPKIHAKIHTDQVTIKCKKGKVKFLYTKPNSKKAHIVPLNQRKRLLQNKKINDAIQRCKSKLKKKLKQNFKDMGLQWSQFTQLDFDNCSDISQDIINKLQIRMQKKYLLGEELFTTEEKKQKYIKRAIRSALQKCLVIKFCSDNKCPQKKN